MFILKSDLYFGLYGRGPDIPVRTKVNLSACAENVSHLVLMAGPLTVLSQAAEGLVDEDHVVFVDVEAEEAEAPGGASTDAVEELQRLAHQVVGGLDVVLEAQVVLQHNEAAGSAHTPYNMTPKETQIPNMLVKM